jgi:hypothetical protein
VFSASAYQITDAELQTLLLLIVLDYVFAALLGFVWIKAELSARTTLPKKIPALIELDLKFLDAGVLII